MAKKDALKTTLLKKKPVKATEKKAKKVDKEVEGGEEKTVKTSVDFREDLYTKMKISLIQKKMTMRDYLESLVEADLGSMQ